MTSALSEFDQKYQTLRLDHLNLKQMLRELVSIRDKIITKRGIPLNEFIEAHQIHAKRLLEEPKKCDAVANNNTTLPEYSKWMENLSKQDKQKHLHEITLPGSHDSAAYELFHEINPNDPLANVLNSLPSHFIADFACKLALTQSKDLTEQLKAGIRYFDIRASYDAEKKVYRTFHLLYGNPLMDLIKDIKKFLDEHQKEIVIIEISHMYGRGSVEARKSLQKDLKEVFGDMLYGSGQNFKESIEDLQNTNKRVILSVDDPIVSEDIDIWNASVLYNTYADTDELDAMEQFNKEKLREFQSQYNQLKFKNFYKISWILTPKLVSESLYELAKKANNKFPAYLQNSKTTHIGQILLFDYIELINIPGLLGYPASDTPSSSPTPKEMRPTEESTKSGETASNLDNHTTKPKTLDDSGGRKIILSSMGIFITLCANLKYIL